MSGHDDHANPGERPAARGPTLLLSANSGWNIANFRGGLIRKLAEAGWQMQAAVPPGDPRLLANLPIERVDIAVDRAGVNPWREWLLLLTYRRLIQRTQPAAYLGWTIKPNIYGALAARGSRVPALLNVSGLGTTFLRGGLVAWLIGLLYRFAFHGAAVVFFQNRDDRDLFVGRRIVRPGQARLLPGSGIDLDRFAATALPAGPPLFLLVGRVLVDKGVRDFVEAIRRLRADGVEAHFRLLGPIDRASRSAIDADEVRGWVAQGLLDYRGEVADVRDEMAAATAIVLPSYREGLPRSLLEGAAMGRILVATDVPGCRDLVDEGVNGRLCQVRNPGSLADAMRRVVLAPVEARAAMGRASRQMAEQRYDEQLVADAYIMALQAVTGRGD